jgi:hypothetical protein
MSSKTPWVVVGGFLAGLVLAGLLQANAASRAALADGKREEPPRFTEEREAAALFFVKKNAPDLLPLLEQLRKSHAGKYEREIREIFQVTEWLAELREEPRRYELELKIWITENKANALVAKLSTPSEEERKKYHSQLQDLAKELVDLDTQVLEWRAEQLDKELGVVKSELATMKENPEKKAKERYDNLLEQVQKRKK